ncbi:hypothetical protein EA187_15590 [Lujinxingia sediminis]|uniref:Tetratricopeptide repeat protein n=1 Tax=Lujinxingia sediminis TaxID=2480984 RepID=A0ABY0CQ43_9DELT|nr:tetratricopeptide repeat protein [Lujinxingia sediminis]RVU42609.1 hypothetical protein EA187_15590 [Lujinxingia sediminis]
MNRCFPIRAHRLAAAAVAAGLLMGALPAAAQQGGGDPHDAAQNAEVHYQIAMRLFNEGRYRESVEEFDQALALLDDPIFWCNRAVPLVKLAEMAQAGESLARCRDGFDPQSDDYAQVDAQLRGLTLVARGVEPRARSVAQMAGPRPLEMAPVALPEAQEGSGRRVAGWALAGAGVGLLASAWVLDLRSATVVHALAEASAQGASRERYDALRSEVALRQRVFWSLAGAGAAATLVGGGLLTWDLLEEAPQPATLSLNPQLQPGLVGVGIRLSR